MGHGLEGEFVEQGGGCVKAAVQDEQNRLGLQRHKNTSGVLRYVQTSKIFFEIYMVDI